MKITITLFDYIKSELINMGKNEFVNNHQITYFDDNYSFLKKSLNYDDDIDKIVTPRLFFDERMTDIEKDKKFKKMYLKNFINKQIAFETIENFAAKNSYVYLSLMDIIEHAMDNLEYLSTGGSITDTQRDNTSNNNYNGAYVDLPDDRVNIDLNSETVEYASNLNVTKNKVVDDDHTKTIHQVYDPDIVQKSLSVIDNIMKEFNRKCFLQIGMI